MSRSSRVYRLLEALLGRRRLWRIGRWLYTGARRELPGGAEDTGEAALIRWLAQAWRPADGAPVLFDVGVNLGHWSVPVCQAFQGRGARLLAFEPGPGQRDRACAALCRGAGDVAWEVRPQAVGAAPGTGRFELTGDTTGSSGLMADPGKEAGRVLEVEITTIDAVIEAENIAHLTFAKVDTEGNDYNVLAGALTALSQQRIGAILFEYNMCWIAFHRSLRDVFDLIEPLDYALGRLTPDGIELYDEWHFELDRFIMTNFLLVSPQMQTRLPCTRWTFDRYNTAVPATGAR